MSSDSSAFNLWVTGCSHLSTDLPHGIRTLAEAIEDSERGGDDGGPAFDWDIMLHLGDLMGGQGTPTDEEGEQFLEQISVTREHGREHIYCLLGNHDASGPDEEPQWWFRKWVDPTGENTAVSGVANAARPYPVAGAFDHYSFEVGNLLFLIMGDRNDGGPPAGRASTKGYPAGRVFSETFEWWQRMVERHPERLVISAHHHMLEDTTVASGMNEGCDGGYHGYREDGAPEGASFIYFLDEQPHARAFEGYLEANPGATDLWLGGHTHADPDDTYGGRGHVEERWGTHFLNCCALTRHHAGKTPMSRLLTFTPGSSQVRVRCYLHTSDFAPKGWHMPAERVLSLSRPFVLP